MLRSRVKSTIPKTELRCGSTLTSKQRMLSGGTVEDYDMGKKMFELLAEMMTKPIIGFTGWESAITPEQVDRVKLE